MKFYNQKEDTLLNDMEMPSHKGESSVAGEGTLSTSTENSNWQYTVDSAMDPPVTPKEDIKVFPQQENSDSFKPEENTVPPSTLQDVATPNKLTVAVEPPQATFCRQHTDQQVVDEQDNRDYWLEVIEKRPELNYFQAEIMRLVCSDSSQSVASLRRARTLLDRLIFLKAEGTST